MSKHTSGPFRVTNKRYVKEDLSIIGLGEDSGRMLAAVHGGKNSGPFFVNDEAEVAANARLFAAAPDLLEALETLAEHFEYYMGDNECRPLENARAAIAKATGEQP